MQSNKCGIEKRAILPDEFEKFRIFLEQHSGIVLADNKSYLVANRLSRFMNEQNFASFTELLAQLEHDNYVRRRVLDAMTTNETSWFRDTYPYEILHQSLLPALLKRRQTSATPASSPSSLIRIWSAACATGQEPYSIAMIVMEYLHKNPGLCAKDNFEIIATDISSAALAKAKQGVYDKSMIGRGLSMERRQRFFVCEDDLWRVRDELKSMLRFHELNLKQGFASLGKFDIIYCRNVLIYFCADLKKEILAHMADTLKPGGYLVVGSSESINALNDDFEMVKWNGGVVYQLTK